MVGQRGHLREVVGCRDVGFKTAVSGATLIQLLSIEKLQDVTGIQDSYGSSQGARYSYGESLLHN